MAEVAEAQLIIDHRLRFALFGLECALGVTFNGIECERIFKDAVEDQASPKSYVVFESPRLVVLGRVDDHEPETICLRVEGGQGSAEILKRVVDNSEFHAFRLRQSL